jgi:regulatory protein
VKIDIAPSEICRELLLLTVDNQERRQLHKAIFGHTPKLQAETLQELQSALETAEKRGARNFIIRRLALKSYSSYELQRLLKERLVSDATAHLLLSEFKALGYLDDEQWLEGYIKSCQAQKYGPRAIASKLRKKGVPEDVASAAIAQSCSSEDSDSAIKRLLTTRYRSRNLSIYKEKQKVVAALLRRGFTFDAIIKAIDSHRHA